MISREAATRQALDIYDEHPNLVARLETVEDSVVVKWFGWRHWIHAVLSPFRASRAWRSWKTAQALQQAGVSTPAPLFVYSRRILGFVRENYFIAAAIHPHHRLRALLKSDASDGLVKIALADLAMNLARMHQAGIFHRDLTSGNFLIDEKGRVYLTDLNRARYLDQLTIHQRLCDLARISFKTGDDFRPKQLAKIFFLVYGAETSLEADWEKEYWEYRGRRLKRRRLKLRIKRLLPR